MVPFTLFVYGFDHKMVWALTGILAFRLLKMDRRLFYVLLVFTVLYGSLRLQDTPLPEGETFEGIVTESSKSEYAFSAIMKTDAGKLRVTHKDHAFEVGEHVRIKGEPEWPKAALFMNGFDYGNYLKSQNVRATVKAENVETLPSVFSIHSVRRSVMAYFEDMHGEASPLMHTFILADNAMLEDEVKDGSAILGVSHLFAVSGLHVAFMLAVLYKGMGLIIKKDGIKEVLAGAFLLFYIALTGAPPSVMRASTMAVFLIITKRFKIPLSAMDGISLLAIIIMIARPYALHDVGFVLSFLVSFTLMLSRDVLNNRPFYIQALMVSLIACLVTVPVVMKLQFQVNLLSIPYNIVFVWGLMFALLPLVYITAILPFLTPLLLVVYKGFEAVIVFLGAYGVLPLKGFIQGGMPRIVYLALFVTLMQATTKTHLLKRSGMLAAYLFIVIVLASFSPFKSLTMFAVDGDSFLIEDRFNRCNVLIDTGNYDDYDALIGALKRKNIRTLDYVFISHEHSDHFGEFHDVHESFNVKNTISETNAHLYEGQTIKCGSLSFYLFPLEYEHGYVNNRSLVLYLDMGKKTLLFTGDIEHAREKTFMDAYKTLPPVDILKAPHHGSSTSSSEAFLDLVDAKEVLISAHPDNTYNHPGKDAIDRFESRSMILHRTDHEGTIVFKEFLGKWFKKTALDP